MKKFIIILITLTLLAVAFNVVLAAEETSGAFTSSLKNNFYNYLNLVASKPGFATGPNTQPGIFTNIIAYVISLVGIIFLILVIVSGLQWMTASGNEEKITTARKRMTQAAIGLGITLGAFVISFTVYSFFYQEYLQEPTGIIEPPPGSEEIIPCTQDSDCEEYEPRIFCLNRQKCVECITDEDCSPQIGPPRPGILPGLTYCHPTWHNCMLPPGTQCNQITSPDLCIARQDCTWVVEWYGGSYEKGICIDSVATDCPQCLENAPLCVDHGGGNVDCVECVDEARDPTGPGTRWPCTFLQTCVQYDCFP